MTIIAALRESDESFLIGSDTRAIDPDLGREIQAKKLYEHPKIRLVCGCAGYLQICKDLGQWFEGQCSPLSWDTLVAELVKQQNTVTRRRGEGGKEEHSADCLLVGWVNGEGRILESRQHHPEQYHSDYYFVGNLAPQAMSIYTALSSLVKQTGIKLTASQALWTIISSTFTPNCWPIDMYRVTPKSVDQLKTAEELIWAPAEIKHFPLWPASQSRTDNNEP